MGGGWRRSVLASAVALGTLVVVSEARAACPADLPGWTIGAPVGLNNGGAALAQAFVRVTVDTSALVAGGKMRADGADIRFMENDCSAPLRHWIEGGVGTANTAIWVKVPNLPASASRAFTLFYGEPSAVSTSSAESVFGAGLVSLFTFTEGAGTTVEDRIGANDLALSGAASWATGPRPGVSAVTGFVAGGRLRGPGGGPALGTGDFTALSLIRPTDLSPVVQGVLGNYAADNVDGWVIKLQGGAGKFMFLTWSGGSYCQDPPGSGLAVNQWSLIGGRKQSGVIKTALLNGTTSDLCAGNAANLAGNVSNASGPFEIGRSYTNQYPFHGAISMSFVWSRALPDAEYKLFDEAIRAQPPSVVVGTGVAIATLGPPTIVSVKPAENAATIAFTPPTNPEGLLITGYEAACSPFGSGVGTLPTSIVASGLANGIEHTCVVRGLTPGGPGEWSATSAPFVPGGGPAITSPSEATFTVGKHGTFKIVASGSPPPTILATGDLPAGVSLSADVIAGTPPRGSVGVYPLSVRAENGIGVEAKQSLNIIVLKADQTISMQPLEPRALGPLKVALAASASSGLPVSFASTTANACSVDGLMISLLRAGTCRIVATQPGDADFNPAPEVVRTFSITGTGDEERDAGAPKVDGSTKSPPVTTLPTVPGADASSSPSNEMTDGLGGGGCSCDVRGRTTSTSAVFVLMFGLGLSVVRRSRRR